MRKSSLSISVSGQRAHFTAQTGLSLETKNGKRRTNDDKRQKTVTEEEGRENKPVFVAVNCGALGLP